MALGIEKCLSACSIQRGAQPSSQLQPRVSANALPSSVSSWSPAATPSKRSIARRSVEVEDAKLAAQSTNTQLESAASVEELVQMLRVVVGVMLIGYFAIGVNWLVRRRRGPRIIEVPAVAYSDMAKA